MPGTQRLIGYKPATNPVGWGGHASTAGVMRGTTFPGLNNGYWIASVGGRLGKFGDSATTMRYGVYKANKSTSNPEERLGNTGTFSVNVKMIDNASGANFERPLLAPVPVAANQPITLALLGTGAPWSHGQDHSGALMYERGGLGGGLPADFNSTNTRPEGRVSAWGVIYDDVAPTIPMATLSPTHGSSTTDETPRIELDFRSENEVLPGFAVGSADKLTKYQVQIWNSAKTSKLRDSDVQDATNTMVTARRVTWDVPEALAPGQYVVRAQVYNALGTKSTWREWTINVVGAGSITVTSPTGTILNLNPDIHWSYAHKQGLAMDKIRLRIMNAAMTEVVRPDIEYDFPTNPAPGGSGIFPWSAAGWPFLTQAGIDYNVQAQAIDTDGQPSMWSAPQRFHLNAPPNTPNYRQPLPGTVTIIIPELSWLASDIDDATETLSTRVELRKQGSSTTAELVGYYNRNTKRWSAQPLVTGDIPAGDYGVWEWRVNASDPHGGMSPWSTWLSFEYAAPPMVTVTSPAGTATIANPPFTWTVDRTQVQFRIRLFDAIAGDPILNGDSGWQISAVGSYTFPTLLLRHGQQVRAELDLLTVGDIPGKATWTFDVTYTPPDMVTGVTATPVEGAFDYRGTKTSVLVDWDAVTTDPQEFDAYVVMRRDPDTNVTVPLVTISDIAQTQWVDDTAPAGSVLEYQVVQRVWRALDVLSSEPASATTMIAKIVGMVITPVIGGGPRVVLPFWENVAVEPVNDRAVRKSWASRPRIISGPMDYRVVSGTAYMVPDLSGRFEANDVLDALIQMARPFVDADGMTRERVACARFWDGRVIYGVITNLVEQGVGEDIRQRSVTLEITESNFNPGVTL